jgi:microsomal dipeptidase-like Zn-dependent dipeptidase
MPLNFIDLHNDVITNLSHARFLKYIAHAQEGGVRAVVVSVWTTRMENPLDQIREARRIEDAWFITEENIDELIACGPFSVGLTWNDRNNLAGGAHSDGSLTPLGKSIIEKLVAPNIIIDLAHLNRQSFFDVGDILRKHKQPLLCTHTCFAEVHPHARNLDRDQVQAIVDSGGIIGLTLVGDFLSTQRPSQIQGFQKACGHDRRNKNQDFS